MKSFRRLPSWLKVLAPATFVWLCLGINAMAKPLPQRIAFTEIRQSIMERRRTDVASQEPSLSAIVQQTTANTTGPNREIIVTPANRPAPASDRTTPRTVLPDTPSPYTTSNSTVTGESTTSESTAVNDSTNATTDPSQSATLDGPLY